MSLHLPVILSAISCFPRVSGDEPDIYHFYSPDGGLSPRERG